jgi:hypothetical protein
VEPSNPLQINAFDLCERCAADIPAAERRYQLRALRRVSDGAGSPAPLWGVQPTPLPNWSARSLPTLVGDQEVITRKAQAQERSRQAKERSRQAQEAQKREAMLSRGARVRERLPGVKLREGMRGG